MTTTEEAITYIIDNFEGAELCHDGKKGLSRYGLNRHDDGIDPESVTKQQAIDKYKEKYVPYIKGKDGETFDQLHPDLKTMVLDTAINFGVGRANEFLKIVEKDHPNDIAAQASEYAKLRRGKHEDIIKAHKPSKYWRNVKAAWEHRDAVIAKLAHVNDVDDIPEAKRYGGDSALNNLANNFTPRDESQLDQTTKTAMDNDEPNGLPPFLKMLMEMVSSLFGGGNTTAMNGLFGGNAQLPNLFGGNQQAAPQTSIA